MGTINLSDTTKVKYAFVIAKKQFDGIFDTDGSFNYAVKLINSLCLSLQEPIHCSIKNLISLQR
jgi:hypothetical protein